MSNPYPPPPHSPPPPPPGGHPRYRPLATRIVEFVVGGITAFILLQLAFDLLQANMGNPLVQFVGAIANFFAWPFLGIFGTGNGDVQAILDYGLAAVAYVLIGVGIRTLFKRHG